MNEESPQSIIVCPQPESAGDVAAIPCQGRPATGPATYRSWRQVPQDEWKTRRQWQEVSRKVKDGEPPKGRVIFTKVVSGMQLLFTIPEKTLYEDDEHAEIIVKEIPLYHLTQTRPAKITRRKLAMLKYLRIFFQHARRDQYIVRLVDAETEKESWTTITALASGDAPWQRKDLLEQHIVQHVNHSVCSMWMDRKLFRRHTIGIKSTDLTRFVAIDLDHHAKDDTELFLKRAEVLLENFHGDGWHYQARDGAVTGIHFIKVFDKAVAIEDAHQQVRAVLEHLDAQYPELDLGKTEIYPTKDGNGFRLPLARGYLMILDRIVEPVVYRKQQAGNVEAYMDWLKNPNRVYFPKDRLLSYLRMNADDKPQPEKATVAAPVPSQLGKLQGRCWSTITGYWLGEFNPANSFDAVVAVTARIASFFDHPQHHTAATISQFARDIPQHAHHCSSRLAAGNWAEIDRCIAKQVNRIYKGNAGQADVEKSDSLLHAAVAAWSSRGLDILDKTTWTIKAQPQAAIILTEEDRRIIEAGLADLLGPREYHHLACDVAIAMAQRVQQKLTMPIKHVRQRAISYDYWRNILEDCGLRLGNRNKIAKILTQQRTLASLPCGAGTPTYSTGQRSTRWETE